MTKRQATKPPLPSVNIENINMAVVDVMFTLFIVQHWPIQRNLAECKTLYKKKTADEQKGCVQPPLLSIPFNHIVIDTLHLFLRIIGLLSNQVLTFHSWMHTVWAQSYQAER